MQSINTYILKEDLMTWENIKLKKQIFEKKVYNGANFIKICLYAY